MRETFLFLLNGTHSEGEWEKREHLLVIEGIPRVSAFANVQLREEMPQSAAFRIRAEPYVEMD